MATTDTPAEKRSLGKKVFSDESGSSLTEMIKIRERRLTGRDVESGRWERERGREDERESRLDVPSERNSELQDLRRNFPDDVARHPSCSLSRGTMPGENYAFQLRMDTRGRTADVSFISLVRRPG